MALLKHVAEHHILEPGENNKVEHHGNINILNENIDEKEHTEEGEFIFGWVYFMKKKCLSERRQEASDDLPATMVVGASVHLVYGVHPPVGSFSTWLYANFFEIDINR